MERVTIALAAALFAHPAIAAPVPRIFEIVVPAGADGTRLAAFSLTVAGGRIGAVRNCPPGWTITANNDPSWRATLTGTAIVGAADILPPTLASLFTVEAAPEQVRHDLRTNLPTVGGTLTTRHGAVLRTASVARFRLLQLPGPAAP